MKMNRVLALILSSVMICIAVPGEVMAAEDSMEELGIDDGEEARQEAISAEEVEDNLEIEDESSVDENQTLSVDDDQEFDDGSNEGVDVVAFSDEENKNREVIANGTEIYGEVHSSVLGGSVTVGKGSVVRDSIIMQGVTIGENCVIEKAIIAEDTVIGNDVSIGIGSEVPNKMKPNIYSGGLATIGENSVIPGGVQIGKNTAISGVTSSEDYIDGVLASGETLIKAGDRV